MVNPDGKDVGSFEASSATTSAELKQNRTVRAVLLGQLTKTKNYIAANINNLNRFQLETKLSVLENQYTNFNNIQTQIERLDENEIESTKRDTYEEIYYLIKSQILEKLEALRPCSSVDASATLLNASAPPVHQPRTYLQKLQLSTFTGSRNKWVDFFDMFSSLVHNNYELSKTEKFHYLRSCTGGDAAKVIQSLEVTASNYDIAIELLKSRYDDKKGIFEDHIKEIFNLQTISKPSSENIRSMVDTINSNLRALRALGTDHQISNGFLLHLVLSKLDGESQARWEDNVAMKQEGNSTSSAQDTFHYPSWDDFARFLERRCKTLTIAENTRLRSQLVTPSFHNAGTRSKGKCVHNNASFLAAKSAPSSCRLCNAQPAHNAFMCAKFCSLSPLDRFKLIKQLHLCINCLKARHTVQGCDSVNKCQRCGANHHTLLHRDQLTSYGSSHPKPNTRCPTPQTTVPVQPAKTDLVSTNVTSTTQQSSLQTNHSESHIVLATALLQLRSHIGTTIIARAILDSASQLNFITESIAQSLRVKREKVNLDVNGIGSVSTVARQKCRLQIQSLNSNYTTEIEVFILPEITSAQPSRRFNVKDWNIPNNIKLADPRFNYPNKIDILIGAGLFFDLLQVGQLKLGETLPFARKTLLGWVISGTMTTDLQSHYNSSHITVAHSGQNDYTMLTTTMPQSPIIEELLQKFWTIEDHQTTPKPLSIEEDECEQYFRATTRKCAVSNKFIVRLPLREERSVLGDSYNIALRRLLSIERKLNRCSEMQTEYRRFMEEYAKLGHMTKLSSEQLVNRRLNYLPHHCVVKPDSSTTKLRVVFDASCQTSSGKSLNDILKVGPTLQDDIFTILARFRTHRFVIMADISQMYRQILVNNSDVDLQCILWRDIITKTIETFQLKTVTYGTSAAPYLAVRSLRRLAEDNAATFPLGSAVTLRDFYVDNLMSGADDINKVRQIKKEVTDMLMLGGFPLRKWAANHPEIIEDIPDQDKESHVILGDTEIVKALGIGWDPINDVFRFKYNNKQHPSTKRGIMSQISQFYDPLGLMNPVIVKAKIFLQTLWKLNLNWDESLPESIYSEWVEYESHLKDIITAQIPRTKAYGACVYIRAENSSRTVSTNLLCAKSRVAPTKEISLPRLELCAAVLLIELLDKIAEMKIIDTAIPTYCWTDSTIVLAWLASEPCRWVTFVANRVSKIQRHSKHRTWNHVQSNDNPADLVSRGVHPTELIKNDFWFHGPTFLNKADTPFPTEFIVDDQDELPDERKGKVALFTTMHTDLITQCKYHNNYLKLIRIFCYVRRFIYNSQPKHPLKFNATISAKELDDALLCIVRNIQQIHFAKEIHHIKLGTSNIRKSRIHQLSPFIADGILRVGGRLNNSDLVYDAAHQIIMPKDHPFVATLIRYHHHRNSHAGSQTLHNILRERFWIISAKRIIHQVLHNCLICFRSRPTLSKQIMGTLPHDRVKPSKPFNTTGVDFCGPLYVSQRIRGRAPYKVYIAIFVCFATKAVHLELVTELSTSAFLAALKRFIARRGKCSTIYSDNATNFTGASRELKELHALFTSEQHKSIIEAECIQDSIQWKFIPPRSPHFGGLWEAAVKVAKFHIRKTIGGALLSFDELSTICCQVEAVMNSRPLTPVSNDPDDMRVITPGHFLVGGPLVTIAEPNIADADFNHIKRYQYVQLVQQRFWNRWSHEYLHELQRRQRWRSPSSNIRNGELVLIKEDNMPPLKWAMGRVIETHAGADGKVRVATIKTAGGVYRRSITKLCPLPIN